jgi:enoyl-[acyl-carrier protein] reductase I
MGADLAVTYLNQKAEPYVRPLAERLGSDVIMPCDLRQPGELEAVFDVIRERWGRLDFLLHSVAFAPREDLHARVVDCSAEGFALAMDVSCHSFIRMTKLAEPLMTEGGCLMTVTFFGAEKVVEHYNMMGPVKAALESSVRYMAAELGGKGIRVHALSPGAMATRAASGIDRFDELLARSAERAPTHHLVTVEDIGPCAAFLASDAARQLTGLTLYIDGVITLSDKDGTGSDRDGTGWPLAIAFAILVLLLSPIVPSAMAQPAEGAPADRVDTLLRAFPDGLTPEQADAVLRS